LDAVPYLFEEEGTNGENLPKTHEFLKRCRKVLDVEYLQNIRKGLVVDLVPGFLCESAVQRRGIALQLEDAPCRGEIRAVTGRMPGGTRGELVAFKQHHVAPAEPREVVERAASDRAASDDDRS